ncbi:Cyclic di-GMP phosphodiesterase response regulator RpfG [Rubripirellula lacrimiformis]|uniref:Cyclic di-GMP phosphodiesterase response regulator RpfG n=1 Tax=Rubripirellula lacrimiformis TaxID=1930273 RepID=A0A517NGC1_9BACT|nr:HD domain-containing phosphohydrolase [Rubripirellula lacrimiformis]QDT06179.1 Cyclic di-GMP phosphodiesterase response regulator RpfG [Rubripirellula lacrimiformis]
MKCKLVPISTLKAGAILSAPIADPHTPSVKLLAEGTAISDQFISRLVARGVESVVLSLRDVAILSAFVPQGRRTKVPPPPAYVRSQSTNDYADALDSHVQFSGPLNVASETPLAETYDKPANCGYADGLPAAWARESDERIDRVNRFFADTAHDSSTDIDPLDQTCEDLLARMAEDQDALVCWACAPYESDYPSRHGVHLATVAMAIGIEMGLGRKAVKDLGIGCLVHDVGMQEVGLEMFDTGRPLGHGQLSRLADHPVRAINIAGEYGESLSDATKFVVYQLHERGDGSGYPRGLTAESIHPLAKIAAVADAFVGMLTNRRHRLAIQGYFAIVNLLEEMQKGKFDARVIRGLLYATSMYPLGSRVWIGDHQVGRVIRSGAENFGFPTVELWDRDRQSEAPAIVNLFEEPQYQITGSLPATRAA